MQLNKSPGTEKIVVGAKYKHFKGGEYEVIGVARHSETLEELVMYRAFYYSSEFGNQAIWARPLKDFLGFKETNEGKKVKRFERIA